MLMWLEAGLYNFPLWVALSSPVSLGNFHWEKLKLAFILLPMFPVFFMCSLGEKCEGSERNYAAGAGNPQEDEDVWNFRLQSICISFISLAHASRHTFLWLRDD